MISLFQWQSACVLENQSSISSHKLWMALEHDLVAKALYCQYYDIDQNLGDSPYLMQACALYANTPDSLEGAWVDPTFRMAQRVLKNYVHKPVDYGILEKEVQSQLRTLQQNFRLVYVPADTVSTILQCQTLLAPDSFYAHFYEVRTVDRPGEEWLQNNYPQTFAKFLSEQDHVSAEQWHSWLQMALDSASYEMTAILFESRFRPSELNSHILQKAIRTGEAAIVNLVLSQGVAAKSADVLLACAQQNAFVLVRAILPYLPTHEREAIKSDLLYLASSEVLDLVSNDGPQVRMRFKTMSY